MTVVVRDIFWKNHFFKSTEELNDFIEYFKKDFDFLYDYSMGSPINVIGLKMIIRDKKDAEHFAKFLDWYWDLYEEERDE